jgi:hypothetical protein
MPHRRLTAALFAPITPFFAIGFKNVHIQTIFSHLARSWMAPILIGRGRICTCSTAKRGA